MTAGSGVVALLVSLQSPPAGALGLAVATGLATFFAPCAYPLLPGYVGYYLTQEEATLGGALVRGAAATLGALVTLGAVGAAMLAAGQSLAARIALLEPVVGLLLVGVGLAIVAGRAPTLHLPLPERRRSIAGFALFGGVYAAAAAGCVVPLVLGVVARAATLPPAAGAATLAAYAVSAAAPLLGVTLLAASGSDLLSGLSGRVGSVRRVAGGVMVVAGLWQVALALRFLGVI